MLSRADEKQCGGKHFALSDAARGSAYKFVWVGPDPACLMTLSKERSGHRHTHIHTGKTM